MKEYVLTPFYFRAENKRLQQLLAAVTALDSDAVSGVTSATRLSGSPCRNPASAKSSPSSEAVTRPSGRLESAVCRHDYGTRWEAAGQPRASLSFCLDSAAAAASAGDGVCTSEAEGRPWSVGPQHRLARLGREPPRSCHVPSQGLERQLASAAAAWARLLAAAKGLWVVSGSRSRRPSIEPVK